MAVVQISRIQVRRGRKGQSNIPQLASGEIGWAVDTQELYIGNGSVAEGAPQVGNTKILTAADNIFDISDQYEFRKGDSIIQTGATSRTPVRNTLQSRLDNIVLVSNFGAVHNTSVIQTAALQRAIDNIFLNTKSSPENRFVLQLEPGLYRIDNTLKLPPYTTLRGAGKDKTIIEQTANAPIFVTVNGSSTIGNYNDTSSLSAANQARNINISGMTLRFESKSPKIFNTVFDLQSSLEGHFYDLKLKGYWDADGDQAASIAINLKSFSASVRSKRNLFENIDIEGFAYGINSSHDIEDNTFKEINFQTLRSAIRLGFDMDDFDETDAEVLAAYLADGQAYGPVHTVFENCTFKEIFNQGFIVYKGEHNISKNNKYYDVGNDGGTSSNATSPVIQFDQIGNHTFDDWFERTQDLCYGSDYVTRSAANSINFDSDTVPYIPEVTGRAVVVSRVVHEINPISTNGQWSTLLRLPSEVSKTYQIPYQYNSINVNGTRHGVLHILIDRENDVISVTDDFEFLGDDNTLTGNANNLTFRGKLVNVLTSVTGTGDTAYIEFKNSTSESSVTLPTITFTITSRT